jgi:glycosyltransferase involved in cell wall biosynthesis
MLLSIIIPVYNVEPYLAECLDSVFSQDNIAVCEVIIVNDGSTDGSVSIIERYQKKYPELIVVHQENKGLSGARNTGINCAKGDYLYFLDSDDFLLQDAVSNILNKIKETTAEIIGFNAKVV